MIGKSRGQPIESIIVLTTSAAESSRVYESSHTAGRHLPRDVAQKVVGMKLTTWTMTRAAFCMVSSTVPFLPPSILTLPIPSFGVKTHFYQQRECFPCNWFGLLGKETHKKKKNKRMKKAAHFSWFQAEYSTSYEGWCEMTLGNPGWTEQQWIIAQSVKAPRLLTWRQELFLTNYLWALLRNPLPTQRPKKRLCSVNTQSAYGGEKEAFLHQKASEIFTYL